MLRENSYSETSDGDNEQHRFNIHSAEEKGVLSSGVVLVYRSVTALNVHMYIISIYLKLWW